MKSRINILLLAAFWSMSFVVSAQSVEALGNIDRDTIKQGERLTFTLNMKAPEGYEVLWPDWGDTLSKSVEIVSHSDIEQQPLDAMGNVWMQQNISVTSFDTGINTIPVVQIEFSPKSDTNIYTAKSAALSFYVQAVSIDTTASFKPIKGPRKAPITFLEILPWLIGILGILAIIALAIWYFVRRQRKTSEIPFFEKPKVPPYTIALESLEELRHKKLWQNDQVKTYYSELTDIVRTYIEDQFDVPAVEMTTDEILAGIRPLNINDDAVGKLRNCLQLADLVKFAKAQPSALEHDLCLDHMISFVKESHANTVAPIQKESSVIKDKKEVL